MCVDGVTGAMPVLIISVCFSTIQEKIVADHNVVQRTVMNGLCFNSYWCLLLAIHLMHNTN